MAGARRARRVVVDVDAANARDASIEDADADAYVPARVTFTSGVDHRGITKTMRHGKRARDDALPPRATSPRYKPSPDGVDELFDISDGDDDARASAAAAAANQFFGHFDDGRGNASTRRAHADGAPTDDDADLFDIGDDDDAMQAHVPDDAASKAALAANQFFGAIC